jgi:hypothetical protein
MIAPHVVFALTTIRHINPAASQQPGGWIGP